MQTVKLTKESSLLVLKLPDTLKRPIGEMIELCPTERGKVVIYGKVLNVPRFQEPFMKPYRFSGIDHQPTRDPPSVILDLQTWIKSLSLAYADGSTFDPSGCLANWYINGDDYIGRHSDDERDLRQVKGCSYVACVSYGGPRNLRIRDKKTKAILLDKTIEANTLYVMAGKFQKELTHEFPRSKTMNQARVSFTFRDFLVTSKRARDTTSE